MHQTLTKSQRFPRRSHLNTCKKTWFGALREKRLWGRIRRIFFSDKRQPLLAVGRYMANRTKDLCWSNDSSIWSRFTLIVCRAHHSQRKALLAYLVGKFVRILDFRSATLLIDFICKSFASKIKNNKMLAWSECIFISYFHDLVKLSRKHSFRNMRKFLKLTYRNFRNKEKISDARPRQWPKAKPLVDGAYQVFADKNGCAIVLMWIRRS